MHERIDFAGAQIAFLTAKAAGAKNVEFTDFLPRWHSAVEQPDSEDELLGKLLAFRAQHVKKKE